VKLKPYGPGAFPSSFGIYFAVKIEQTETNQKKRNKWNEANALFCRRSGFNIGRGDCIPPDFETDFPQVRPSAEDKSH
jgi:hypothetical protein